MKFGCRVARTTTATCPTYHLRLVSSSSIMSKKKSSEPEPPRLLGRVGSHLKAGIVGLPNVGKSSLFNILT